MIELLDSSHKDAVKHLFSSPRYMGLDYKKDLFLEADAEFMKIAYDGFCDTYLSNLSNFKAYGNIDAGVVTSYIAFYESTESAEWFWTQIRSKDRMSIPDILDTVISYNEKHGRYKFYSMFSARYARTYRRLTFSKDVSERYDFFDEFIVPAKTKCFYQVPWQVLFNRTLVPVDSIVRCTFLKQKYREILPIGGGL